MEDSGSTYGLGELQLVAAEGTHVDGRKMEARVAHEHQIVISFDLLGQAHSLEKPHAFLVVI